MKVLFAGMRWDYKQQARGYSFEFTNFWDSLRRIKGVEAELFPFDEVEVANGRDGMNRELLRRVDETQPDLVFFFFFEDEFDPVTVSQITKRTLTLNWFADDQWRFGIYSKYWAPHLSWVATTDAVAAARYRKLGFENVIRTQWGCNHNTYKPLGLDRDVDVSFVGQPHGKRKHMVQHLRNQGLSVKTYGFGWEEGRIPQDEMIAVFNRTKINLNLSNASREINPRYLAALVLHKKGPLIVPNFGRIRRNLTEFKAKSRDQIKGRNFEIPGCRTFMLTSQVDGLEEYFEQGKEVVTFKGVDDLTDKVRHYLQNTDEASRIAKAAYERTLREHTYEKRFEQIFERIGLR